jgi:hypothetical protein
MVSRPYKSVTLDPHCELRAHMLLLSACVPCTTDRVRSGPAGWAARVPAALGNGRTDRGAFSGPLKKVSADPY